MAKTFTNSQEQVCWKLESRGTTNYLSNDLVTAEHTYLIYYSALNDQAYIYQSSVCMAVSMHYLWMCIYMYEFTHKYKVVKRHTDSHTTIHPVYQMPNKKARMRHIQHFILAMKMVSIADTALTTTHSPHSHFKLPLTHPTHILNYHSLTPLTFDK